MKGSIMISTFYVRKDDQLWSSTRKSKPILYCFKFVFWLLMTNNKQNEFYQILNKNQQIMDEFFRAPGQWSPQPGENMKMFETMDFLILKKMFWMESKKIMTLMAIILPFNQAGFPSLGQRTSFPAAHMPALSKGIKPKAPASKGQSLTQGTSWPKPVRRPSRQNPNQDSVLINFWP